jgi:uncharacterized protein YjbJ (UPF0337 family)
MNNTQAQKNAQKPGQNQDIIQSQWSQIQTQVKDRWTDLTDADIQRAEGSHDYLVSKLQQRCNFSLDKAEQEVSSFENELRSSSKTSTAQQQRNTDSGVSQR